MRVPSIIRAPVLAAAVSGVCLAGCGTTVPVNRGRVPIVAAEATWGSIAGQLGGGRVAVRSVIADPGIDPHAYEPSVGDAIAFAEARLAVVNGIGYDRWAGRLLGAQTGGPRRVLDVGRLTGLGLGDNPHQWYSPASVVRVSDAVTALLDRLDPAGRAYYAARRIFFLRVALAPYFAELAVIRRRYAGAAVGASESVFAPLAAALGLRVRTPAAFTRAVAEGTGVAAGDLQRAEADAREHRITVWVYNRQNATPEVQRVTDAARAAGVPVVTVTETLDPAGTSFQAWQVAQLRALAAALRRGTGR